MTTPSNAHPEGQSSHPQAATLEFRNVSKTYEGSGEPAIQDLSFEVPAGEICVLVGPSGCGKTTAMRLVNRMIEMTSGDILVGGVSVRTRRPADLRREIGYAIQQIGLFPHQTIAENIATVPRVLGWPRERIRARVDELIELIGLDAAETRDRYPAQLSGGQRQRVGVARALAADPPLMLMDEPFGAIDPINRERLQNELLRLQERIRKTIVFVTHDINEAIKLGDRIAVLKQGGVLAQYATPVELLMAPRRRLRRGLRGRRPRAQAPGPHARERGRAAAGRQRPALRARPRRERAPGGVGARRRAPPGAHGARRRVPARRAQRPAAQPGPARRRRRRRGARAGRARRSMSSTSCSNARTRRERPDDPRPGRRRLLPRPLAAAATAAWPTTASARTGSSTTSTATCRPSGSTCSWSWCRSASASRSPSPSRWRRIASAGSSARSPRSTGILYTIPSLAFFFLLLPITGRGNTTALIALTAYTLLILFRNIVDGLDGVPEEARDAGRGMGLTYRQLLWRVELPLALPTIMAGLRIAATTTVGLAALATFAGAGGLGDQMASQKEFISNIAVGGGAVRADGRRAGRHPAAGPAPAHPVDAREDGMTLAFLGRPRRRAAVHRHQERGSRRRAGRRQPAAAAAARAPAHHRRLRRDRHRDRAADRARGWATASAARSSSSA